MLLAFTLPPSDAQDLSGIHTFNTELYLPCLFGIKTVAYACLWFGAWDQMKCDTLTLKLVDRAAGYPEHR